MSVTERAMRNVVAILAVACAAMAGCIAVLDQPVYRTRHDAQTTSDATSDARDGSVDRPDASADVRSDGSHDAADAGENDVVPDLVVTDDVVELEASFDDVVELEASFDDVVELEASIDDAVVIPVDAVVATDVSIPVDVLPCPTCRSGETCCAGRCVNLSLNEQNCGACGLICPAPGVCQSGRCGRCLLGILCGAEQRCGIGGLLCGGILCP